MWSRLNRYYENNVDTYICLTDFQKGKLIENGFPPDRIEIIPNAFRPLSKPESPRESQKDYIAFSGRLSPEKGIELLMEAARSLSHIQFKFAGTVREGLKFENLPNNVELCGKLEASEMNKFYQGSRALVVPSLCYEGFPAVITEAMSQGIPVIAPRIGGIPEIVTDMENGLLFNYNDALSLSEKIDFLWNNDKMVSEMGQKGLKTVQEEYNFNSSLNKLIQVYNRTQGE
jgi:glycosyltransferase involved in cell wall biosynthesis